MLGFSCSLCFLLAVIFLAVPSQAKTKEEWTEHLTKVDAGCKIALNGKYPGEKLAQMLVEATTQLPRDIACYMNCFEQKSLDMSSYGPDYNKRWQEGMMEMMKDDVKSQSNAMKIFEACKDKVGKDDCDTASLRFFCKKEMATKMGIMK